MNCAIALNMRSPPDPPIPVEEWWNSSVVELVKGGIVRGGGGGAGSDKEEILKGPGPGQGRNMPGIYLHALSN